MSAEYELGRAMRTANRGNDAVQRTREAAAMIGVPEIDPKGINLPSLRSIDEARSVAAMPHLTDRFLLGDFARGMFGDQWAATLGQPTHQLEAEEAVDVSFFRNITGQLLVTWTQKAYMDPQFVGDKLFDTLTEPQPWNLETHIVPKISSVQQGPNQIQPGMPYGNAQIIQDYISYPAIGKFGETLNVTLEAMGTDRTGQIGENAAKLGFRARYDLEVQQLAVAMGITVTVGTVTIVGNNFSWLGTTYNTYQTGGSNWVNALNGVTVAGNNYTMIANLETLMSNILDPYSGIVIGDNLQRSEMKLLCPYAMRYEFKNILKADSVRSGPYGTSTPNYQENAPNPLDFDYEVLPSAIAYQLLVASGVSTSNALNYWFLANWKKAFKYREVLPWQVITAPLLNEADFTQDIVQRIKVRRMGTPGVHDPRFAFKSYGS